LTIRPVKTPIWPAAVAAGLPENSWINPETCAEHMLDLVQNHASGSVMRVDDLGGTVEPLYGMQEPKYNWSFTGSRQKQILGHLEEISKQATESKI